MTRRPGRRRGWLPVGVPLLVAVLTACTGPGGGLVTVCSAVGYSARLEVRLDDSWPDRDAYGVAVSCVGTAEPCALVRDGTIRLVPEQEPTTLPPDGLDALDETDQAETPGSSPEPTPAVAPEPAAGEWTGSALDGPVGTVVVRVVEVASGDVVVEREVEPEWESTGDEAPGCGGPSLATVEITDPRA